MAPDTSAVELARRLHAERESTREARGGAGWGWGRRVRQKQRRQAASTTACGRARGARWPRRAGEQRAANRLSHNELPDARPAAAGGVLAEGARRTHFSAGPSLTRGRRRGARAVSALSPRAHRRSAASAAPRSQQQAQASPRRTGMTGAPDETPPSGTPVRPVVRMRVSDSIACVVEAHTRSTGAPSAARHHPPFAPAVAALADPRRRPAFPRVPARGTPAATAKRLLVIERSAARCPPQDLVLVCSAHHVGTLAVTPSASHRPSPPGLTRDPDTFRRLAAVRSRPAECTLRASTAPSFRRQEPRTVDRRSRSIDSLGYTSAVCSETLIDPHCLVLQHITSTACSSSQVHSRPFEIRISQTILRSAPVAPQRRHHHLAEPLGTRQEALRASLPPSSVPLCRQGHSGRATQRQPTVAACHACLAAANQSLTHLRAWRALAIARAPGTRLDPSSSPTPRHAPTHVVCCHITPVLLSDHCVGNCTAPLARPGPYSGPHCARRPALGHGSGVCADLSTLL